MFYKCININDNILNYYPIILNEPHCHCLGIDVKLTNQSISIFFKNAEPYCCGGYEFTIINKNIGFLYAIEINCNIITFIGRGDNIGRSDNIGPEDNDNIAQFVIESTCHKSNEIVVSVDKGNEREFFTYIV